MNEDFEDLLRSLVERGARFLVVGAHALAVHGVPRATGDLDVWIARDRQNVERVWEALEGFGAPTDALSISCRRWKCPSSDEKRCSRTNARWDGFAISATSNLSPAPPTIRRGAPWGEPPGSGVIRLGPA